MSSANISDMQVAYITEFLRTSTNEVEIAYICGTFNLGIRKEGPRVTREGVPIGVVKTICFGDDLNNPCNSEVRDEFLVEDFRPEIPIWKKWVVDPFDVVKYLEKNGIISRRTLVYEGDIAREYEFVTKYGYKFVYIEIK